MGQGAGVPPGLLLHKMGKRPVPQRGLAWEVFECKQQER